MEDALQKLLEEAWVMYCLRQAQENVRPLVEKERESEKPQQGLLEMRLD
jgi:hypothetical protein